MTRWHRFFYVLQFAVLSAFITLICFENLLTPNRLMMMLFAVYFSEFAILEKQRTMNKHAVLYQKSGFFSLLDLFSVGAFILYSWYCTWMYFFSEGITVFKWPFIALLLYTLFRKVYIYKHYTYEIR